MRGERGSGEKINKRRESEGEEGEGEVKSEGGYETGEVWKRGREMKKKEIFHNSRTHTRTHARTHTRTHTRTDARTHKYTHVHTPVPFSHELNGPKGRPSFQ